MSNDAKIKLAEQALTAHKIRLRTTTNKDEVRRAIKATQARLAELRRA